MKKVRESSLHIEFEQLMTHLRQQKIDYERSKTVEEKRAGRQNIKHVDTKRTSFVAQPWRVSNTNNYLFEQDPLYQRGSDLNPREVYRINLLPRTYDRTAERRKSEVRYKVPAKEFGQPSRSLLTKAGRLTVRKNFSNNMEYAERKRNEEEFRANNKRKIIEMQDQRKWNPALHRS